MMRRYHYTECGLDNIYIDDVEVVHDQHGEEVVRIPRIGALHRLIAKVLIDKQGPLAGRELRFLRTEMGLTQAQLAAIIQVDAQTVGRWERGETPIPAAADMLVRKLASERLAIDPQLSVEELARRYAVGLRQMEVRITARDGRYELAA